MVRMLKEEEKVHKTMEDFSTWKVTMVRMLMEEVKVHKTMEDFFPWKCDNGMNVKGRSKST
jgi:DNA gyrase inhibitor GyrI